MAVRSGHSKPAPAPTAPYQVAPLRETTVPWDSAEILTALTRLADATCFGGTATEEYGDCCVVLGQINGQSHSISSARLHALSASLQL